MSDGGSVSSGELGDELGSLAELADYDPQRAPGEEEDKRAPAGGSDGGGSDGDGSDGDSDGDGSDGGIEADSPGAARAARLRRPRVSHQAAQAVGSRRIYVVAAENRVTSNVMTKAEATRAIALRAQQIANYPNAFVDPEGLTRAKDIAQKELYAHRSPLVLRRCVGRTRRGERVIEKWPVRQMSYPAHD